jgi:glucose-1-phosphate cytidylyltransferase
MREETEFKPKPMVQIGGRPVLWHIMKVFAAHGHTDFVICAGYKGDQIKQYFYNYAASNMDFTVTLGGGPERAVFHGAQNETGWTVTVADTGLSTPTGGRLKIVERYLDGSPFFCTYGDGIADIDLGALLEGHHASGKVATVSVAVPKSRFGLVEIGDHDNVIGFHEKPDSDSPVSMGYFVLGPAVFDLLTKESVLEEEPLAELARRDELSVYRHGGFWQPMDTYREYQALNALWDTGAPPWQKWVPDHST